MNVLGYDKKNEELLVRLLTMMETGTYVRVCFAEFTPVYMKRIDKPRDVLDMCEKAARRIGHHPMVYEIGTFDGVVSGIELWCR